MWRSFEPHVERFASACASQAVSTDRFSISGPPAGGGSTAVPVAMPSGLAAYAKPARAQPGDVAREWLAFMLGYRVGLPLASVQISRETANLTFPLPPVVALSYNMLAQGRPFGQLTLSPQEQDAARPIFSAMHAFHAWIDDHDHFGGANTHIERMPDGSIQLSFFDYSFSLTHQWGPPASPIHRNEWKHPTGPYANPDPLVINRVIDLIQQIPLTDLQSVAGTLPPDCMSAGDGAALAAALHQRGQQLKAVLT